MTDHWTLSDDAFLQGIQTQTLPAAAFTHEAHLRLAFICLEQAPLSEASEQVCALIRQFATANGAPDKFHLTLTLACVQVVAHFMTRMPGSSFAALMEAFPALKTDMPDLLHRHYRPERLALKEGKTAYIAPDLLPFAPALPIV